jgi:protocatechuate 3,4-dioxygenase beta subunit
MSQKKLQHRGLKSFMLSLLASSWLLADISGTVYKDFNLNGQKDGGDAFVSGVSIKAVCEDGNTYNATTDTNGAYTLTGFPAGNKCRVEVDPSSAGVGSGPNALGSAPLVDMVTDGSTHHVSVGSPATYCQTNPDVIMAAMPGYHTPGSYGSGQAGGQPPHQDAGTVFMVPAPSTGEFNANGTIGSKRTTIATFGQTGAIWGSAWKKGAKSLFVSATLKRYVPLKDESSASAVMNSAGTIYKIDTTTNPATVSPFAVVPDVLSSTAATELSSRDYGFNKDTKITAYTGRMGLGDIEISEDETKLYTVNIHKRELVIIDANSGDILQNVAIPNPYTNAECDDSMVRPWATKVRGSDVFIGSVCEDKIENGVGAAIQKYNGAIFQTIAKTNSLTYLRARSYGPINQPLGDGYRYANWTNLSYSNGPMLTDIEFTNSGDLVLGYTSRIAYNRIGGLYSDVRKMCLNADGSYTDESSDVAPTSCATHTVTYQGNPTDYFEFYTGDYFGENYGESGHPETASGALAQAPGAPNIIVGMIDGTDWYQPGAIGNYDNITGDKIGAQAVIDSRPMNSGGEREMYGSKAGGMGDVELLCDPAPIEIGNYVWVDGNQDGIQDPSEPPFANIQVTLTCNGTQIGTATTDANGHYYFGGPNNTNLTAGNTLTAGESCVLSIAQADVNNKPPTVTDPNSNANDDIDNDAVENGSNNEISFTTTAFNNHDLDFGITPTIGCVTGQLFLDNNNDGIFNGTDTVAPAGIELTIIDSFGGVQTATTDSLGQYTLNSVPAGSVTVSVDTTDTDIPDGAVWTTSSSTITVIEGTPPAGCTDSSFPYTLPSPVDQDPADNAMCANPTSITWDGSTVSTMTVWQDMLDNPLAVTTAGGTTVNVTMTITDNDGEFYDTDTTNSSGSGTSAAFGQPYLTLYLGDQPNPGNGTYNDAANCAANGYDLEAGESSTLEVVFDQEVVLDNWRIRDVDSGDVRGTTSNWEWQDGIKVEGFDAAGNSVDIEAKIGSSGVGLIVDGNNIVHTDSATYDAGGGDFITGGGTAPNATNGHIVLTSNLVPIKKIVITHSAGPDVPCQTRSALAMAGLAVCKPLHISGHVYNDEDGVAPNTACDTSDNKVDGTLMSDINATALNVCLIDNAGKVLDTQVLNNGAYDFNKYILPNTNYKVIVTTATCTKGEDAPETVLPESWNYEGEQIDPENNPGSDGTPDGSINVAVADANVENIDFALNKAPTAQGYIRPSEINPGGTTQVQIVPAGAPIAGFITDQEEGVPAKIRIETIPGNGVVYYNANPVSVGDVIDAPNPDGFTFDPNDGDVEAAFSYVSMDKACKVSQPAFLKVSFGVPKISGNLYIDTNNNGQVDGNATNKSCDANTPLFVNLIGKNDNKVIASTALSEDGSYVFYNPDVQPNSSYILVLSQTQGQAGDEKPSADLPEGCMNTGENRGTDANNPEDTTGDGEITVDLEGTDIPELNFGISPSVKIGDLVWIEDDNDGDATTGAITPVSGATVTAVCGSNTFTAATDANGKYAIEVPQNSTCLVSVPTPLGKKATAGSTDNSAGENNKSHDNKGTTVTVATTDDLTLDFGFVAGQDGVYKIGTHFWIDENANGIFDANEKPVTGALVELFDANGTKISDVTTNANGEYGFDVPAGTYQVKFNIPNTPEYEGYAFSKQANNTDDTKNINTANNRGFTQRVTVGPNAKEQVLTMDAGINCGCSNISSDSTDAQSVISMLVMMLFTFMTALYYVRKEEEQNV